MSMGPKPRLPVYAGKMFDLSFCHHCNVNKLDPKDKYFLPNGIESANGARSGMRWEVRSELRAFGRRRR